MGSHEMISQFKNFDLPFWEWFLGEIGFMNRIRFVGIVVGGYIWMSVLEVMYIHNICGTTECGMESPTS